MVLMKRRREKRVISTVSVGVLAASGHHVDISRGISPCNLHSFSAKIMPILQRVTEAQGCKMAFPVSPRSAGHSPRYSPLNCLLISH